MTASDALRCGVLIALAMVTACSGGGGGSSSGSVPPAQQPTASPAPTARATATPTPAATFTALPAYSGSPAHLNDPVTIGPVQVVEPAGALGFYDWADEPPSDLRQPDGTYRFWTLGDNGTAGLSSPDLVTFTSLAGNGVQVLAPADPGGSEFDSDYAGAGTVFPSSSGKDLLMIYHAEHHYGIANTVFPARASIGIARSTDNGTTWTREGQIITSENPTPSTVTGNVYNGAGNPTAIVAGGYIYVFFDDDPLPTGGTYVPMAVARAPYSGDGAPGSWMKYSNGSFSTPGLGGTADDISPAFGGVQYSYAHFVSYNSYLNAYLLFTESNYGYYFSTSTDLVHWAAPEEIEAAAVNLYTTIQNESNVGHTPYTLGGAMISLDQPSNEITDQSGYLYYPSLSANGSHSLIRQSYYFGSESTLLSVIPATVRVGGGTSETFTVAGGSGSYQQTNTCANVATIAGPSGGVFTATGVAAGQCTANVSDGSGHTSAVPIIVTTVPITIQMRGRAR